MNLSATSETMSATQMVDIMIDALEISGGVPAGIYTIDDLRSALDRRGIIDSVLPGTDQTMRALLSEHYDAIVADLAEHAE